MILRFTKWAVLALPLFAGGMATSPSGDVVAPPPPAELEAAPDPEEAGAPSAELITRTADGVARLLDTGEHDKAMAILQEADPRAQSPALVYMRGVVEEDRGNCRDAMDHYEHYIDMGVPDVDAEAARRRRDRCARLLEAARAQTEPAVAPPVTPTPSPPRDEPRRRVDPWAIALTSVGVVGVGVGAGLFGQGRVDENAARGAFDLQTYRERGERAASLQRTGVAVMVVGGGILAVGIARFVWVSVARRTPASGGSAHRSPMLFRF